MFNQEQYEEVVEYFELGEFTYLEIAQALDIPYFRIVTYLSKYLREINQNNNN